MIHSLSFVAASLVLWFIRYFTVYLRRRRRTRELAEEHHCAPPPCYPHKDPFLGLDLFLDTKRNLEKNSLLRGFKDRYDRCGQTHQVKNMGTTEIHTIDPKNLQTVHALNFGHYGVQPIRRDATLPFLGEGVFTMDGQSWEHSRAMIRPSFTRTNITNLDAFKVHFRKFLDLIPRDGATVDLKPLLGRLFLDTSTEFLFGEAVGALSQATPFKSQEFLDAFHYAQRSVGDRIKLGKLMFLHHDKKFTEACNTVHAFADHFVNKALQQQQKELISKDNATKEESDGAGCHYILLREMAKESNDPIELRHEILHVFLAGHDSTAITLSNAFFYLSRHPEKWAKLRAGVLAVGDALLTFELLKNMKYIQYTLKETLRLHPVAPGDTRIADRDTVLPTGGGPFGTSPVLVAAGQRVSSNSYALHRRTASFGPDAASFRPERWETLRPGWAYQPFGGGPRICPGQQLALTQAAYVLARMAREWKACECRDDVREWVELLKMTVESRNGVKVALIPA